MKARLSENMKVPLTINHSLTIQHMIGIRFDNMLNQTSIMTFLDSNEARGGLKSGGFLHHAKFICTKPTCFCICICIGDLGL